MRKLAARAGVAIVVYSKVGTNRLLAWVITRGGELTSKSLSIPDEETSLTQLVELMRRGIGVRARQSAPPAARSSSKATPGSDDMPIAVDEASLQRRLRQIEDLPLEGTPSRPRLVEVFGVVRR